MKNKVLISLNVPTLTSNYDIYIPVNERMDRVINLILKALKDLTENDLSKEDKQYLLINAVTGEVYGNNDIIRNTNIRHGTKLILISNKK